MAEESGASGRQSRAVCELDKEEKRQQEEKTKWVGKDSGLYRIQAEQLGCRDSWRPGKLTN